MSHRGAAALIVLLLATLTRPGWCADTASLIADGESRLKTGELEAGLSLFRQAAEQDPTSTLAHTRMGGALLLKQEHGAAIASFRQAIMLDGNNADAFVGMAMAYLHSGDYALARASLEEAKRIDPTKQPQVDEVIGYIDRREAGADAH